MGLVRASGRLGGRFRPVGLAAFAAAIMLVFVGCATDSAPAPSALKTIDPASFKTVVEAAAKKLTVPGAFVLVRTPQGTVVAGVGTTKLGERTPPEANTHFRIASNTKTMTAAVIVLLAQDGKLKLSDPVSAYVPNVPNGNVITIAQLLKMRTGLYGYTQDPEFSAAMDADPRKAWTPQQVLAIAYRHPPVFAPDTSFEYSNTNYALLGLIAEKVGGQPLARQFQDRLFGPLGMTQTSLPAANDTSMPEPYSHGYMYGGTVYALRDDPYPADMQAAARAGTLQPTDYTNQNPSYAYAAGGAISTGTDIATWIRALVSGKVLNAEYQKQWLDSLQPEDATRPDWQKYGYGISYQRFGTNAAMYYHGGELPGFNSFMGYDRDNDVTLVVWANLTLSPESMTTANGMLPAILNEIYTGLNL